jgi:hypothetical protein
MTDDGIDRTDEYVELIAEDERREAAARNGQPDDIPLPPEPDVGDHDGGDHEVGDEPTTWEPIDLGPWMNGEITQPEPSLGITRTDGLRLMYPGREHAVLGETESGKTWLALGCVAAELAVGNHVVYIHYEEGDPGSTIERLRLLDVDPTMITGRLRFVAPHRPARIEWVTALLQPKPTLVVHDGVNEAMSLIGAEIKDVDGAAMFRRRLVTPFLRAGAATLACDHMPMVRDSGRRDAYGSVHKGNTLDGARIMLENVAPFGRHMRGVSYVFATKDRPGHLRANGRPGKTPGKTFMGTFVVDDSETFSPDFAMRFYAPKDDDKPADDDQTAGLTEAVHQLIDELPGHTVSSMRMLLAEMRKTGHRIRNNTVRDAVDDLLVAGLLTEVSGTHGARGYRAASASQDPSE